MAIRPFANLDKKPAADGLVTTRWFYREIRKILSKLHFTGNGVEVREGADGQVHFEFSSSGASSSPFAVALSTDSSGRTTLTIQPGKVIEYQHVYPGGQNIVPHWPVVGGAPLSEARTIIVPSLRTYYVALRMTHDKLTGNSKGAPWHIVTTGALQTSYLQRKYGDIPGADSVMDLAVAKIDNGTVEQIVDGNVRVISAWNTIITSW